MSPFEQELIFHQSALGAFAQKLTRNPDRAQDLVQMTNIRALVGRDRFQVGTNMRSWLFKIMHNEFQAAGRKERNEGIRLSQLLETGHTGPDDAHKVLEYKQTLEHMQILSEYERTALTAVGLMGFTHEEVINQEGMSPVALETRLKRARKKLRQMA